MLQCQSLPASLTAVLQGLRSCFTAPSFRTFTVLLAGLVTQTGVRTVCGMLTAAGLAGVWHHSRAHWFFSGARWSADRLGLAVFTLILQRLLPGQERVLLAVDDTLFRRCGRKVYGTGWHHDATSPARKHAVAWGNNWVVVGVLVSLPFSSRPVCLPVAARLWRKHGPAKPELARTLVQQIAAACPGRRVDVVADAFYGTRHWRGLAGNITLTTRLRTNACLHEAHTPVPGAMGRPKRIGDKIGTPDALAARLRWRTAQVSRYGRTDTTRLAEHRCLWTGPLRTALIRVILVRDTTTRPDGRGYDLAILTTDLDSPAEQIITRYAARWAIEVTFHDTKHILGVGQARNRTRRAVERTVPFGLFTHSIIISWYTLTGHHPDDITHRRQTEPWYTTKTQPAYLDMITKLRHTIIAARFKPTTPRPATTEEILAVHQAWAAAAA